MTVKIRMFHAKKPTSLDGFSPPPDILAFQDPALLAATKDNPGADETRATAAGAVSAAAAGGESTDRSLEQVIGLPWSTCS